MKVNVTFFTKHNHFCFKFEPTDLEQFVKTTLYGNHNLNTPSEGRLSNPDYYIEAGLGTNQIVVYDKNGLKIYGGPKDDFKLPSKFKSTDLMGMFRIVYNSGSHPGRKRAIKLLEIHKSHIHAIELDSGDPKNYSLEFIGAVEKID